MLQNEVVTEHFARVRLIVIVTMPLTRHTLYPQHSYTYNGTVIPMFVQW